MKKFLILAFALLNISLLAQKNVEKQSLVWMRYHINAKITDDWSVQSEVENRVYSNPWRKHHFFGLVQAQHKLSHQLTAGLGLTYLEIHVPQFPEDEIEDIVHEIRPYLTLSHKSKLGEKWTLSHRLKPEFRFLEDLETNKIEFTRLRLRYKMQIAYKINEKWKAKANNEIFINTSSKTTYNVFDQNRASLAMQYTINPHFAIQTGYLYWFQQTATGVDYFSRNIWMVGLIHNVSLMKKEKL